MTKSKSHKVILVGVQIALLVLLALWSWILVTPGLIFSQNAWYLQTQTYLQETFYANRPLITIVYALVIGALMINYWHLVRQQWSASWKQILGLTAVLSVPLLFAYNALSADVFNYLFNAKMLAVYHDNPHVHTALDYQSDTWVRFMHNIHTPAPYGYGWTAVSLVPYYLGFGKFTGAWLSFRLCSWLLVLATVASVWAIGKRVSGKSIAQTIWWLVFNPLLAIEMVMNIHNDLWMMLPALWALYLLWPQKKKKTWWQIIASILLYAFSLTIKFATLALLPFWGCLLIINCQDWIKIHWLQKWKPLWKRITFLATTYFFDGCALAMLLPLLTARSQRFHPWYLTWSLIFWPLARRDEIRLGGWILTASALARYIPYLWTNGYSQTQWGAEQAIALLPITIYGGYLLYTKCVQKNKQPSLDV